MIDRQSHHIPCQAHHSSTQAIQKDETIIVNCTAMNLEPSGLKDAPPSSLKCMGEGIAKDFTVDRSDMLRNTTWDMKLDKSRENIF